MNAKVVIFSAFLLVVSIVVIHLAYEKRYQDALAEMKAETKQVYTVQDKDMALEMIRKEHVKTMLRAYSAGMKDGAGQANGGLVKYTPKPRLDPPDFKPDLEQEKPK
ncbi:hypothetical protein CMI47_11070 [Candidatus Pacearchaeota archaeon]|nr:hypothetical protein [Candidatus Pacearchaeota archaeon]|tara:strand:+ start:1653 stop:1973 length:321 start_codon:yes stop_codon:yes gene_type:complete